MSEHSDQPRPKDLSSDINQQQIRLDNLDGKVDGSIRLHETSEDTQAAPSAETVADVSNVYIERVNEVQEYISQLRTQVEIEKNMAATKLGTKEIGPDWMALQEVYANVEENLHTMLLSVDATSAIAERTKYTTQIDNFIEQLKAAPQQRDSLGQLQEAAGTTNVDEHNSAEESVQQKITQEKLLAKLPPGLTELMAAKLGVTAAELSVHPDVPKFIIQEKQRMHDELQYQITKKGDQKKMMQAQIDDLIAHTGASEYNLLDIFTSKIASEDTLVKASVEQIKNSRKRIHETEQEIGQIASITTKIDIALALFNADMARAGGRTHEADRRLLQLYDDHGDGLLEQKYTERTFLKKNPPSNKSIVQYSRHTPVDVLRERMKRNDIPAYLRYRTGQVDGKERVIDWSMDGTSWMPIEQTEVVGGAFDGKKPSLEQEEFLKKLAAANGDVLLIQAEDVSQLTAKIEFGAAKDTELANEIQAAAERLRANGGLTPFEEKYYFKTDNTAGDDLRIAIKNKNNVDSQADIVDQIRTRNTFAITSSVSVAKKYIGEGRNRGLGLYYQGRKQEHLNSYIESTLQYSNGASVTVLLHPNTKKILDSLPVDKQPILLRPLTSISIYDTTGLQGRREMKVAPYECIVNESDIGYVNKEGEVYQHNGPKIDLQTNEHGKHIESQLHTRRSFTVSEFTSPYTINNIDNTPYGKLLVNVQTQSGKVAKGVKVTTEAKQMMDVMPPTGMTLVLKRIPRSIELSEKFSIGHGRAAAGYAQHVLFTDTITVQDLEYATIQNGALITRLNATTNDTDPKSVKDIEVERELQSRDVIRAMKHDRDINFTRRAASTMDNTVQNLQGILSAKDAGSAREPFIQFAQAEARPMLAMLKDSNTMQQLQFAKQKLFDVKNSSSGVALTGIESEIDAQIRALDGFIAMIQSGHTQHLLETILDASKFTANTWENWFSDELPTIAAAIIVATAAIVSITVTFGGATPLWVAAAGAAGGLIAQEAIAEAQYYKRQGSAAVQAGLVGNTERSLLGKKLTGQKKFNEATGQYEDLEWFDDIVSPYAKQFAFSFASTYGIVVGGSFAGGVLGKILSNPNVLAKFATRLPALTKALVRMSSKSVETLGKAKNIKEIFARAANTLPKEVLEEFGDEVQEGLLEKFLNHIEEAVVVADSLDGTLEWGTIAAGALTMIKSVRLGQSKVSYKVQGTVTHTNILQSAQNYKVALEAQHMIVTDMGDGYLQIQDPETGNILHAVPLENNAESTEHSMYEEPLAILRANSTDLTVLKNYLKQRNIDATTRAVLVTEVLLSSPATAQLAANLDQLQAIVTAVEAAHNKPGGIDTGTTLENTAKHGVIYDALLEQGIAHEQALIIAKRFTDAGLAGKPSEPSRVEASSELQTVKVYSMAINGSVQINLPTLQVGNDLVMVQVQNGTEVSFNRGKIKKIAKDDKKITITDESDFEYKLIIPVQTVNTTALELANKQPTEVTRQANVIPAEQKANWQKIVKPNSPNVVQSDQFKDRFISALQSRNLKTCADTIVQDIQDADSAVEWIIASKDVCNGKFVTAAGRSNVEDFSASFQRSVVDSFASKPETMRAEIVGTLVEQGQVDLAKRLAKTFKNEGAFNIVDYGSNHAPSAVGRALVSIANTEFKRDSRAPLEVKMKAEQGLVTLATNARDAIAKKVAGKDVDYQQMNNLPSVVALKNGIVEYQKRHGKGDLDANLRSTLANILLNVDLGVAEQATLQAAHALPGKIDTLTDAEAFAKGRTLMAGENSFTRLQAKLLLDAGLAGYTLPPPPALRNNPVNNTMVPRYQKGNLPPPPGMVEKIAKAEAQKTQAVVVNRLNNELTKSGILESAAQQRVIQLIADTGLCEQNGSTSFTEDPSVQITATESKNYSSEEITRAKVEDKQRGIQRLVTYTVNNRELKIINIDGEKELNINGKRVIAPVRTELSPRQEEIVVNAMLKTGESLAQLGLNQKFDTTLIKVRDTDSGNRLMDDKLNLYLPALNQHIANLEAKGFTDEQIVVELSGQMLHENIHGIDDMQSSDRAIYENKISVGEVSTITAQTAYYLINNLFTQTSYSNDHIADGVLLMVAGEQTTIDYELATTVSAELLHRHLASNFPDVAALAPAGTALDAVRFIVQNVTKTENSKMTVALQAAMVDAANPDVINTIITEIRNGEAKGISKHTADQMNLALEILNAAKSGNVEKVRAYVKQYGLGSAAKKVIVRNLLLSDDITSSSAAKQETIKQIVEIIENVKGVSPEQAE